MFREVRRGSKRDRPPDFMRVVAHTLCNAICAPSPPKARCLPLIRFLRQASQPLGDAARAPAQTAGSCGRRRRGAGVPVQWGGAAPSLGTAVCKHMHFRYRDMHSRFANAHRTPEIS